MADLPIQPSAGPAMAPVYQLAPRRGRDGLWRFWPDVAQGAPPAVFLAALVAAVVTAVTEPYAWNGIGGVLTGLAVAAAPLAVVLTSRSARWRLVRPLPIAAGVATLALVFVGAARAAGWLYALCLLTALGLGSYGLVAGRRWPGVFFGAAAAPIGLLRGIPWLARGVRRWRLGGAPLRTAGVLVGTALLLLIFGALFASADAAFDKVVGALLPDFKPRLIVRVVMGVLVGCFALGAAFATRVPPRFDRIGRGQPRPVRRIDWLLPLGALVLLFATFVGVQLTVLFGGDEHVLRTAGLTYAEYARQGFGQLVAVTVLTLGVLAAVARWAPRQSRSDQLLLRLVGGALCLLTLVIVASALYRLNLYQQAYGFTQLRLFVDAFELWLGVVFLLILAAGAALRGGWLPRVVVATGVATLLALAALDPDAFVARQNLDRYQESHKIDLEYLGYLSADAVPVLDRLPEPQRSCALAPIAASLKDPDPWYAYNGSRDRARELLANHPIHPSPTCTR